eukprot:10107192-Lingulodinium_polyedra.AAC.1
MPRLPHRTPPGSPPGAAEARAPAAAEARAAVPLGPRAAAPIAGWRGGGRRPGRGAWRANAGRGQRPRSAGSR